MGKYLLLTILAITTALSYGQGIKIIHVDDPNTDISGTEVEAVGDISDARIYYDMRVINLTGQSIDIRYQRKRTADSNRDDEICDANLCYSATDDLWYQTPVAVTVDHEDTTLLKPQIAPENMESCGIHVYYVALNGNVLDSVTVKFRTTNANCFLNLEDESQAVNGFNIFPNPAEKMLTIENLTNDSESIIIYDALGKEVLRNEVQGIDQYVNLSNLKNGLYFVHVLNAKGVLSDPKKLIVRK